MLGPLLLFILTDLHVAWIVVRPYGFISIGLYVAMISIDSIDLSAGFLSDLVSLPDGSQSMVISLLDTNLYSRGLSICQSTVRRTLFLLNIFCIPFCGPQPADMIMIRSVGIISAVFKFHPFPGA